MQTAFRSEERFTQAEFFDWVEENRRYLHGRCELVGGQIVMTPPAGFPHESVITRLVLAIGNHIADVGLGQVARFERRLRDALR